MVNSSVLHVIGIYQLLFELEFITGTSVVWTWVIRQNGNFAIQGSREKFGNISYSNLHGFIVSFVPFPKVSFSDPPWFPHSQTSLQILLSTFHQILGARAPPIFSGEAHAV
jgi:hypothetical protein